MSNNLYFVKHILDSNHYPSPITQLNHSCWRNYRSLNFEVEFINYITCEICDVFYYRIFLDRNYIIRCNINPSWMEGIADLFNRANPHIREIEVWESDFIKEICDYGSLNYYDFMNETCGLDLSNINLVEHEFVCPHEVEFDSEDSGIEATAGTLQFNSILHGFIANSYGFVNTARWKNEKTFDSMISNWILEAVNLSVNFNVTTVALTMLKLLNEFKPLTEFIKPFCELFKTALEFVAKQYNKSIEYFFSNQQSTESIEPTFGDLSSFAGFTALNRFDTGKIEVLACVVAAATLLFGTVIIGKSYESSGSANKTVTKLSSMFRFAANTKSGIYALIDMFKDFKKYLTFTLLNLITGSKDDLLVSLVSMTTILESENCRKEMFFTYIDFLCLPSNLLLIGKSKTNKDQLIFVIKIIEEIMLDNANQQCELPLETSRYLALKLAELKKVRNFVFKSEGNKMTRFTPFWINLIGPSGCGKSQSMPFIINTMMRLLEERLPGEIPEQDQWYYAVNFTDKFMTNYKQHYVVGIDDLFQDASPLGERSSALDLISWCSNITYHTNQAALEDKGIPFESKIIISSSNDFSVNRKEIVDKMAILRRMNVRAEFDINEAYEPDENLGDKRVKIKLYKHIDANTKTLIKTCNTEEFIGYCVEQYLAWFKHQNELLTSRQPSNELLNKIRHSLNFTSNPQPLSLSPDSSKDFQSRLAKVIAELDEETSEGEVEIESTFGWLNSARDTYYHVCNSLCEYSKIKDVLTARGFTFNVEDHHKVYACCCETHFPLNISYLEYVQYCNYFAEVPKVITGYNEQQPSSYSDKFNTGFKSLMDTVTEYLKSNVAIMVLAAFGVIAGYKVISAIMGSEEKEEQEDIEVCATVSKYTTAVKRVVKSKAKIPKIETTGSTMSVTSPTADQQTLDLSNLLIKSGAVCRIEDYKRKLTNVAIRFYDTCFISNHHFFNNMEEGDKFDVVVDTKGENGFRSTQTYSSSRIRQIGNLDVVIYKCDNSIRHARSLLKHFPDGDIIVKDQRAMIVTNKSGIVYVENTYAEAVTKKATYTSGDTQYDILDSYHINTAVDKGTSGSILLAYDEKLTTKILGIQTARETKYRTGYFRPISRSNLQQCLVELGCDLKIDPDIAIDVTSGPCPGNLPLKRLQYLGVVPKNKVVKQNVKSKIIPSLIQDPNKLTQQPSVLNAYDERLDEEFYGKPLLYRGIQGFDEQIGTIDTETLDFCAKDLAIEYKTGLIYPGIERRLLNDWEVVNGIPGYLSKLDLRTSPGYPFVLQRTRTDLRGKFEWFNELPDSEFGKTYEMTKELRGWLEQRESLAKNGINKSTIAVACLKDETRPLEKIRNGKTRVFICLPLDYNLLIRKYFGAFVAAQHALAGTITSCVGIDPATQWRKLLEKLSEKNIKFEDFDYSNWDQHLHPEIVMKVAEIVNYWYGTDNLSEEGKVRRVLIYELIHTTIMVKDRLFRKSSGQCSGCAITAELNCIVHDLLMYFTWTKMCQDQNIETSLRDYRHNVAAIIYGDDIIISVLQNSPIKFCGNTIAPYMDELGMSITPGDKTSKEFSTKFPNELSFLKRTFIEHGDLVKAPLRLDIVQNIVQWIHESDDPVNATTVNCEMALQEAYMHGPVVFEDLKTDINNRIQKYNEARVKNGLSIMPGISLNYESFDRKYKDYTFTCIGMPIM